MLISGSISCIREMKMKSLDEIKEILSQTLSPSRYRHTLGTADMAVRYAKLLGADPERAYLAGIIHDCVKNYSNEELLKEARRYGLPIDEVSQKNAHLLHGAVGAAHAKEVFGVTDGEILSAVSCHTTGKPNMTKLEKILFLADLTEENREYEFVAEIRETAFLDFDKALIMAYDSTIQFVLRQEGLLHPDTVYARNDLILSREIT